MKNLIKNSAIGIFLLFLSCSEEDPTPSSQLLLIDEPPGENCEQGGTRIDSWIDLNGNGSIEESEITSTAYVCNGSTGTKSLVKIETEPIGENCENGGIKVLVGLDMNENDTLDISEIMAEEFVCNGINGTNALIRITEETQGDNCENGGVKIEVGLDHNGDGELNEIEITTTEYVCHGSVCTSLPNPVAFYPFNGNANDESGNANNGAVFGASLTQDRFGYENSAYSFDGLDDYIQITSDEKNTLTNSDFAISFWFKSNSSSEGVIWNKRNTSSCSQASGASTGVSQASEGNGNVLQAMARSSTQYNMASSNSVFDNEWHFASLVRNGITLLFYLDGDLIESLEMLEDEDFTTTLDLYIGKTIYCTGNHFNGQIDDFRIDNVALSFCQIQNLYNME